MVLKEWAKSASKHLLDLPPNKCIRPCSDLILVSSRAIKYHHKARRYLCVIMWQCLIAYLVVMIWETISDSDTDSVAKIFSAQFHFNNSHKRACSETWMTDDRKKPQLFFKSEKNYQERYWCMQAKVCKNWTLFGKEHYNSVAHGQLFTITSTKMVIHPPCIAIIPILKKLSYHFANILLCWFLYYL